MKIGIFGCSFADVNSCHYPELNKGQAWSDILSKTFNHDITNYAVSASSFYYSYQLFKKEYNKFDKIIFLGTWPGRLYCLNLEQHHITPRHTDPSNRWTVNNDKEYKLICDYYSLLFNMDESIEMKRLMAADILSYDNTLYIDSEKTLGYVTMMENIAYNITDMQYTDFRENRYCHMSNENNYILATNIDKWLKGGTYDFSLDMFRVPLLAEKMGYFYAA